MTVKIGRSGWHPSLPGVLFLLWALLIPILDGNLMVNADGDPARHLRHGETILESGDVIRNDVFSYTALGKPFVGFEFGSQILFALGYRFGGLAGMVVLAAIAIAGTIGLIARWLLRSGVDPLLTFLASTTVAMLTYIHWLARPHVFSWPLVVLLLGLLEVRPRPSLLWFGCLFVVWVNLHGAFLFGAILVAMYVVGHVLEALTSKDPEVRRREWSRTRGTAWILPIIALATLVNPYGWHLPAHLIGFFGDPYLQDVTNEFLSPDFHSAALRPFLLVLLLSMLLLATRPRMHWTHLTVLLGNAAMALIAQRNIIFFALVSVPLLAIDLGPAWDKVMERFSVIRRFANAATSGRTTPYAVGTVLLLGFMAYSHGRIAGRQLIDADFSPTRFPVEAVALGRDAGLQGRIFHEFTWGGYLLWAWPEQRVFIDGGTDFYGPDLVRTHRTILGLTPGWRDSLSTYGIDLVLVEAEGSLAAELQRDSTWTTWYRDSTAVLLRRQ
jgi:hypothetical protein